MISTDFTGLFNQRFFNNLFPFPASNDFKLAVKTPDFILTDVKNKKQVKLSDFYGQKPVILAFTRIFTEKQYCPLCYPHIMELNQRYEEFVQRNMEVLMITSTDYKQSEIVVRDLDLKFPLLSDSSCQIFRDYQVGQALGAPLPAQFVLDIDGKLRYKHLFSFLDPNADVERLLKLF